MSQGQVVVDGPARRVMSESLVFASQVNKLFRDPRLLTPEDVLDSLPVEMRDNRSNNIEVFE